MKTPRNAFIATVGIVLLAPLVVPVFIPWSGINCRHEEINIKTGEARSSRYLWFVNLSQQIEHTPLSVTLQGESVDAADIEAWHRVNTFSPGARHSPHYTFHSALHQADQLKMIASCRQLSAERRHEIAEAILTAWQLSGSASGADALINNLME